MHTQGGRSFINLGYSPLSDIQLVRVGEESMLEYKYYIDPALKIQLFRAPTPVKSLPEESPLDEIILQLLPALKTDLSGYPIRDVHRTSDIVFGVINRESADGKKFAELLHRHPEANLVALTHSLAWNPSAEGAVYLFLRDEGFNSDTHYLNSKESMVQLSYCRMGKKFTYGIRIDR